MTYENKFQTGLWDNLKLSFKVSTYPIIILVLTTIMYFILSTFGTMTEKGSTKFLMTIAGLLIISTIIIVWTMLTVAPNEKSVTINENSLTINFPFFKKGKVILFSEIICIHVNRTDDKGEAQIRIKSTDTKFGLNEDYEVVTSLKTKDWKELATKKKLPLIINSDIEEKKQKEVGTLRTNLFKR